MLTITNRELEYLAEDACVDAFDGYPDAARRLEEFAAEAQQRGMPPFGVFWGRWGRMRLRGEVGGGESLQTSTRKPREGLRACG